MPVKDDKSDAAAQSDVQSPDATDKPADASAASKSDDKSAKPEGFRIERSRRQATDVETDTAKEPELWERDDAPPGSTSSSLLHYDESGRPDRVSGPTHYTHLANGQIVGGYGVGTHYTDDDGNVVPVLAHYAG